MTDTELPRRTGADDHVIDLPRIVSVDDHVIEPAHLFSTWLPGTAIAGPVR